MLLGIADDGPSTSTGAYTDTETIAWLLRRVRAATVEAMLKHEDQLRVCGSVQRLLRAAVTAAHAPGWHPAAAAARLDAEDAANDDDDDEMDED